MRQIYHVDTPTYEEFSEMKSDIAEIKSLLQVIAKSDELLITIAQGAELANRSVKWVHGQIDLGHIKLEPTEGVKKMKRSTFLEFLAKHKQGKFKKK